MEFASARHCAALHAGPRSRHRQGPLPRPIRRAAAIPVIGLAVRRASGSGQQGDVTACAKCWRRCVDQGAPCSTGARYARRSGRRRFARNSTSRRKSSGTKSNVAPAWRRIRRSAAARAQIDESFRRFGVDTIDLIQVHNLGDVPTQLGILKQLKKSGRIRYIGVTCTSKGQYPELERVMRNEPLDFIGVDYAVDNREAEEKILPLAAERRIAVMVYVPFGRTRLFQRVGNRARCRIGLRFRCGELGAVLHQVLPRPPAVTVVTPATSKVQHMVENIGGGIGRLPDSAPLRRAMAELVAALPPG